MGASVAVGFGVGLLLGAAATVEFCWTGDKLLGEVLLQAEPNNAKYSIASKNGLV